VTAAGYITRETTIQTTTSRIDIIRDAAPFSLTFYRQFARDGFEQPNALDVVRSLRQAPAFYLQTKGLSADVVRSLESAARAVVPMFTGSTFTVATFETGAELRPRQNGWIVVDTHDDSSESANCGQAYPGAPDGSIWINTSQTCYRNTDMLLSTFAHEIGHALGFSHVDNPRFLMYRDWAEGILLPGPRRTLSATTAPSRRESCPRAVLTSASRETGIRISTPQTSVREASARSRRESL